jgi:short subunit dehydrogenase-like uncharacterized protein
MKNILLYGANGYTAQLILELMLKSNLKPILAGRTESKIKTLADKYNLSYRTFDLNNPTVINQALADVEVVLHCAGPYIHTAKPMVEACIKTQTHYLDITGEIDVFEMLHQYDEQAKRAKIMVLPGCGFDVVPTDCLAKFLSDQMPDATHLSLGFASRGGGLSHGTAMTAIENLGESGKVRENGKIVERPIAHKTQLLEFGNEFKSYGITIPWGDVATAFYSTEIPNIEVFFGVPERSIRLMQMQSSLNFLLKTKVVKSLAKAFLNKRKEAGPDEKTRNKAKSYVWGRVRNASGNRKTAYLITQETYTLTAITAVNIVQKVLNDNYTIGFQTPSNAYGLDLIMEVPNTELIG